SLVSALQIAQTFNRGLAVCGPSNSRLTSGHALAPSLPWNARSRQCGAADCGAARDLEDCSMREERRRTPRHQLGRVAAIFFGQGEEHACLVKDYSDGGVRLQLNDFEIPDDFVLLFAPNELA